ncbi:MAG: M28 family peptidase [Bacteroidota bacterium]
MMRKLIMFLLGLLSLGLILLVLAWFIATQPLLFAGKTGSAVEVDPVRLERHVRLMAERFAPRDYKHADNLDSVAAYIRGEFERTGGRVSEQAYEVGGNTYRNVILQLGPDTEERIVVGAHYDAAREFSGADDNASGTAGLIELAHLLDNTTLPMTVELVAYTLEEPPFFRTDKMGSVLHAKSLQERGISVRMMISVEMIGYFSDEESSQHYPSSFLSLFYPTEGNFIVVIGDLGSLSDVRRVKLSMHRAMELPVYSMNAPPSLVAGIDWSDHLSYWERGYPAVMVNNTAFLRDLSWHTDTDTPDRLDYERMATVVVGLYEAVLDLAQE